MLTKNKIKCSNQNTGNNCANRTENKLALLVMMITCINRALSDLALSTHVVYL